MNQSFKKIKFCSLNELNLISFSPIKEQTFVFQYAAYAGAGVHDGGGVSGWWLVRPGRRRLG